MYSSAGSKAAFDEVRLGLYWLLSKVIRVSALDQLLGGLGGLLGSTSIAVKDHVKVYIV